MKETLKKYFGYDTFRNGQQEIITQILNNNDTLGIMPTGGGKSICFQVPAIKFTGITLVISPLISLMQDQVMSLIATGVPSAYINSSLNTKQIRKALENAKNYKYKLIYVAPERLLTEEFIDFAQSVEISMITIDEAHCISQWGQDFRPSYTKIPEFIDKLDKRPIISAFTATATKRVSDDIVDRLKLKNPFIKVTGFNRDNLYFSVQNPSKKFETLLRFLHTRKDKNGIIYCLSRKKVEEVCDKLSQQGFSVTRYHAGLGDYERKLNQEEFLYDKCKIMVATNAFGMGIDKADVSYVVHYNMPKDIESYYQEAGRAGRDGSQAECLLLYGGGDVRTQQWMIENSRDNKELDEETEKIVIQQDLERLKMMTFYSTTTECLRSFILKYFGENPENFCGKCSNCDTNFDLVDITEDARKIISCVRKMGERFGVSLVIEVLRGSKNERVSKFGLETLSTYGILEKSVRELNDIINFLIQKGYLQKTIGDFPVIKWTETTRELLADDVVLQMRIAKARQKVETLKVSATGEIDEKYLGLFEQLRELRLKLAKLQGVPPYVIFGDKSLIDMCVQIPIKRDEFLQIYGVGAKKYEQFGEQFLKVIRDYESLM
ncbi:MAG: DNA helicase RecQ [Clostridia bacterium]